MQDQHRRDEDLGFESNLGKESSKNHNHTLFVRNWVDDSWQSSIEHMQNFLHLKVSLIGMEFEEKRVRGLEIIGREWCERIPCNTRIQIAISK
jgi:hypothetical protein